jgi:hypothetical protein
MGGISSSVSSVPPVSSVSPASPVGGKRKEITQSPLVIIRAETVEKSLDKIVNCIVSKEYLEAGIKKDDIKNSIRDFIFGNKDSIKMLKALMKSRDTRRTTKKSKVFYVNDETSFMNYKIYS